MITEPTLPTWDEIDIKVRNCEEIDPVEEFIYYQSPEDEDELEDFEKRLKGLILFLT